MNKGWTQPNNSVLHVLGSTSTHTHTLEYMSRLFSWRIEQVLGWREPIVNTRVFLLWRQNKFRAWKAMKVIFFIQNHNGTIRLLKRVKRKYCIYLCYCLCFILCDWSDCLVFCHFIEGLFYITDKDTHGASVLYFFQLPWKSYITVSCYYIV